MSERGEQTMKKKDTTIQMKISSDFKERIRAAADYRGIWSVTQYILSVVEQDVKQIEKERRKEVIESAKATEAMLNEE